MDADKAQAPHPNTSTAAARTKTHRRFLHTAESAANRCIIRETLNSLRRGTPPVPVPLIILLLVALSGIAGIILLDGLLDKQNFGAAVQPVARLSSSSLRHGVKTASAKP